MANNNQSELLNTCLSELHQSLSSKLIQVKNAVSKYVSKSSASEVQRFTMHELIELRHYYMGEDQKLRECYRKLKGLGASASELNQIVTLVKKIDELYCIADDIIKENEKHSSKKQPIMKK